MEVEAATTVGGSGSDSSSQVESEDGVPVLDLRLVDEVRTPSSFSQACASQPCDSMWTWATTFLYDKQSYSATCRCAFALCVL